MSTAVRIAVVAIHSVFFVARQILCYRLLESLDTEDIHTTIHLNCDHLNMHLKKCERDLKFGTLTLDSVMIGHLLAPSARELACKPAPKASKTPKQMHKFTQRSWSRI
jgi:hypothetical protein